MLGNIEPGEAGAGDEQESPSSAKSGSNPLFRTATAAPTSSGGVSHGGVSGAPLPPPPLTKCSHCMSEVSTRATTYPFCGATRRSITTTLWKSRREGLKTDIALAILAALVIWSLVVGVLVWIVGNASSDSSSPRSGNCSLYDPDYPYC